MHARSLFQRTVRLLLTAAPALVLAGCEDRPLPTAVLPPNRPSLDLVAGHCAVTSTADAGDGSLRARIADPACSTITFDLTLPATITLTSGFLVIDRDVSIHGPGADKLTVSRSLAVGTRLFGIFLTGHGVTSEISGVTISNGSAPLNIGNGGGGITNNGVLTLSHSVVTGNTALRAGGISNEGTMVITHSLVSNNTSYGAGGIDNSFGAMTLEHSTVSGNTSQGGGGGIYNVRSDLAITHTTITGNSAMQGGGIWVDDLASVRIRSSVIAGNRVTAVHTNDPNSLGEGPDVFWAPSATSVVASYSLIGNPGGHSLTATPENGNLIGTVDTPVDPKLGPLALNAPGATATHALLEGSPAIDAGACTDLQGNPVTDDQRGVARPQGATCDMGAYELGPVDVTPPMLAPVVSPNPVLLNGAATATPNATDASGIASSSCATPNTGSVGSHSVTCTATDNAGNIATASASYQVTYQFGGFLSPVNGDALNGANAGQTVPLKWRLTDASGAPVTNLTTATVTVASLVCTLGNTANQVEESAAGGSGLQNLGNGYYQFNWKTPKTYAGSCKTMQLDLGEGITRNAPFEFKK